MTRLGHSVFLWGPGQNAKGSCDLGIVANWECVYPVVHKCKKHVTVCHGIIDAEKPPPKGPVVFTSEGVRDYWKGEGPIIRQPIDLDFWSPSPSEPKHFLTRFSYRLGLPFVQEIADEMGLTYQHVRKLSQHGVRVILRESACVLATGRAALEAMACDVPVVLCDNRSSYQRALMDLNTKSAMQRNYSGRGGITPTRENVRVAIDAAIQRGSLREHVKRYHDVRNIVPELLKVAA